MGNKKTATKTTWTPVKEIDLKIGQWVKHEDYGKCLITEVDKRNDEVYYYRRGDDDFIDEAMNGDSLRDFCLNVTHLGPLVDISCLTPPK